MIRRSWRTTLCRPGFIGREWTSFFQWKTCARILGAILTGMMFLIPSSAYAQASQATVPTTVAPPAQPTPAPAPVGNGAPPNPADKKPGDKSSDKDKNVTDQKIIFNPFMPGGAVNADQMISRKEVTVLLEEQESRLKKEIGAQSLNPDDLSKLVANAATPVSAPKPDNFMGCVNGIPLYRQMDGTLDLGTKDPEPIRQERCGQ